MDERVDIFSEKRFLGDVGEAVRRRAGGAGLVMVALGVAAAFLTAHARETLFFAYLTAYAYVLSLVLGGLFFVILQHLTKAGWSVVVRRFGEVVAAASVLMAVLFVPLLFGIGDLYHWSHPEVMAADPVLALKRPYLNVGFFVVRWVVYLGTWIALSRFFLARSLAQDGSGDYRETVRMERWAPAAIILYAFTLTFASFDLLMSLDPHWYSTIFGVYYYSGAVVGFLAFLPIALVFLQRRGVLADAVTPEHYHDLGKLLFAFVVFWAYIAFSQYMLIWYANIPEETEWLLRRQTHGWGWFGIALIFGHFLIPFLLLLGRWAKRRPAALAAVAGWMLLMHWIDVVWLVKPAAGEGALVSVSDVLLSVGMTALLVAAVAHTLHRRSLVPERDPRLDESLGFENA